MIYILFDGVNAEKSAKVHGGGNFARWITNEINTYIYENQLAEMFSLGVLWPKGVLPQTAEEKAIFENKSYIINEIESINEVVFNIEDILFIPVGESCHVDLERLKDEYPELIIKTVIHGIRNYDLLRYESYQKYYHTWYKPLPGMGAFSYFRQIRNFKREIKKVRSACKVSSEIFTDTNNSLQLIIKLANPKRIQYYHPATLIDTSYGKTGEYIFNEKYMLLINANRVEKNSLRTLVAFFKYKLENPNETLKFYMVGMNSHMKSVVKYIKGISPEFVYNEIKMFDYVYSDELKELFRQSYFLIYPSKSEGYGLPLLDAMECGIPIVATRFTSVPEVLGTAAYYVDPFDTNSICEGICFMSSPDNNKYYRKRISEIRPVVRKRLELDKRAMVEDILEIRK